MTTRYEDDLGTGTVTERTSLPNGASVETVTPGAGPSLPVTTVTGPDGSSWFGFLDQPGAVLWGLSPGANDVEFTMGGAAAGSEVSLTWRNRWETA